MDWINEKAKTLRQGAIRAMFDKASTMDNVISMGIGEPDMATPELVCRAGNEALEKGITHYTPNAGTLALRRKTGGAVWAQLLGIAFFGGFLFQLVWETKSRYCFPFFVFLLPLAAVGFITALRWAGDKSAK